MCSPSNNAVVNSLISQESLWNYIYSQRLERKKRMGLITHGITFWKYLNIYCILLMFFCLLAWKTLLPPSERNKKKEIQISRCGGIDEVEKLWLKGMINPLLDGLLFLSCSTYSCKSNIQDTAGVAKFNFAYVPRKVSQCILQLFMLWPFITVSALAGTISCLDFSVE